MSIQSFITTILIENAGIYARYSVGKVELYTLGAK